MKENFIICNYHCIWCYDWDDGSNHHTALDSVLVYGGFKTYLGHEKTAINNLYIYPDSKREEDPNGSPNGSANDFFTEPHCANTAGKHEVYGWGEVYRNNTCVIKNPELYMYTYVGEHFDELVSWG